MTVTWITRSMAIVGMVCALALTGCAPADEEASDAAPTEEAAPTDSDAEAEE